MNKRIQQLVNQAGDYVNEVYTGPVRSKTPGKIWEDGHVGWHTQFNEKFAELIVAEAFRAGMLYSAKKYAEVCEDQFTGNDVAMFLEMEACELSDEDIKQHFGVEE